MAPRKLNAQSIYLHPEHAELLDKLSEQSRIPKAVLLREAVGDMLAKYGFCESSSVMLLREALRRAEPILKRYRTRTEETLWQKKIDEALDEIERVKDAYSMESIRQS